MLISESTQTKGCQETSGGTIPGDGTAWQHKAPLSWPLPEGTLAVQEAPGPSGATTPCERSAVQHEPM